MELKDFTLEKIENVAVATITRPESLNAFRDTTIAELQKILEHVANDDDTRALILTGSGRAFSAGIDLKEMRAQLDSYQNLKFAREKMQAIQALTRRIVSHPKIIIAAINGIAIGIGAELSIACDVRIASEQAQFMFPEAKRGLFVSNGVTYFLPRIVGYGRALTWILTGERVSAQEALAAGLVTRIVPNDSLKESAIMMAQAIAGSSPVSLRRVKQVLQRTYDADLEGMLQLEIAALLDCFANEDFAEGMKAFVEKRPAVYVKNSETSGR